MAIAPDGTIIKLVEEMEEELKEIEDSITSTDVDVVVDNTGEGDNSGEDEVNEDEVNDEDDEENLKETVQSALAQIEEKQYVAQLIARGVPQERIRCYGFAFEGKTVLIG